MENKAGEYIKLTKIQLCLALFALFFINTILWRWDGNPLVSTNVSVPASPGCFAHDPNNATTAPPSMEPDEDTQQQKQPAETKEMSSVETNTCNYGKGRWVADKSRPLYSTECKYINSRWACRFMKNRTDFSYEGYRWQPSDCDLPEFDPSDFLKRMQNKVIAIVGDSLSREHTESLMCMLTRDQPQDKIDEVEDVTEQYGFLPLTFVHKKHGWAYRFRTTNTTIVHSWSTRLCDREPVNPDDPDSFFAIHLDRQPAFIRNYIHQINVLVINTAHHWSKLQMDKYNELMFINGTRIQDDHDPLWNMTNARMFKINNIVQWLESQMDLYPKLQVFFRTFSPVHFFKGDWNTGGKCDNTIPMTRGSEVLTDESSDKVVADALKGTRIKILDITALSDLRDEAHISHFRDRGYDCMHWCLPGIPDTWNELLIAQVH